MWMIELIGCLESCFIMDWLSMMRMRRSSMTRSGIGGGWCNNRTTSTTTGGRCYYSILTPILINQVFEMVHYVS